jgi:superfamily II DNA or RNA helicase
MKNQSLKSVNWKRVYSTSEHNLINDFFKPALKSSVRYDRGVGFFSSSWVREAAEGLAEFAYNDGKARWVTSPILAEKDWDALIKGTENEVNSMLGHLMLRNIEAMKDELVRETLSALAWMVSDGIIEFKLACPRNKLSGDFHSKFGVFYDAHGHRIGFNGSYNDSLHGLTNDETISVYPAWEPVLEEFVEDYEKRFERLWNNQDGNVRVYDLPEAAKNEILQLREYDRPYPETESVSNAIEIIRRENHLNRFCFPSNFDPRVYQKEAIKSWAEKGKNSGILAMATGSGKTLTSLWAAKLVADQCKPLVVVIVCPFINLASQWVGEINGIGMECVECFDRSRLEWEKELEKEYAALMLGTKEVLPIIVSNATYTTKNFQGCLKTDKIVHMLIADEVHNLGSEKLTESLSQEIKIRMGLSATPHRHYDDEGTQALFDYFGEPVFEYSLKDAINDGHLTRYFYYPILIDLTEEETDEYWDITQKLSRYHSNDEKGGLPEYMKNLLIKRTRLLSGARNKMDSLKETIENLEDHELVFEKALVYCGDVSVIDEDSNERLRNIEEVTQLLYEMNFKVNKITYEEDREQRDVAVNALKSGEIHSLVAIRCMDEGIDIPDARLGFIMASSTNPRQFVQRRGRLLRKAKGKKYAHIFDFVVRPPDLSLYSPDGHSYKKVERNLFKRELERIKEFCNDAENGPVAMGKLREIRDRYNLLGYE